MPERVAVLSLGRRARRGVGLQVPFWPVCSGGVLHQQMIFTQNPDSRYSRFLSGRFKSKADYSAIAVLAMTISATLTLIYCRVLGWRSFAEPWGGAIESLASLTSYFFEDFAVLSVLYMLAAIQRKWFSGVVGAMAVIAISFFVALTGLGNVFALHIVGSPIDSAWLAEINLRDAGTAIPMVEAYISPSMKRLAFICLVIFPLVSLVASVWLVERIAQVNLAIALGLIASGLSYYAVANTNFTVEQGLMVRNPIYHETRLLVFPSKVERFLAGHGPGHDQEVPRSFYRQPEQAATLGCCKGFNIVLITLDTVPLKSLRSALDVSNSGKYPSLSRLKSNGSEFENFYTNYPMSAQSMGAMITSIYPSFSPLFSTMEEVYDRKIDTLISVLNKNNYNTGILMSGQLKYAGAKELLVSQGIGSMIDSDSMKCGARDNITLSLYAHLGDDCLADHAVRWLAKNHQDKFFAWIWFTNPHSPYFTKDRAHVGGQLGSRRQHMDALRETDAAIGKILRKLEDLDLEKNTLIVLVGDHGEAFGEHGQLNHGASVYEEQVRVPMLVYGPESVTSAVDPGRIGSMVDLAPSILDLVGISAPQGWQGRSLYSADHPNRAYFGSKRSGKMIGLREGGYKYILSSNHDRLLAFDLMSDPNESFPKKLDQSREAEIMNEISAFVSYRNSLTWPRNVEAIQAGN
jgi:lipoteichoic acid synthase